MSVIAASEIFDGRGFASDRETRRYDRLWLVKTNLRHDEGFVIQSSQLGFGIPTVGVQHPADQDARVVSVRGTQSSGPFIWTLTVSYSTESDDEEDPTEDPIEFSWDDEFESKATKKDRDGNLMGNSAGDPYDEPIEVEVGIKVVTIRMNVSGSQPLPDWVFDLPSDPVLGRYTLNDADIIIDDKEMVFETALFRRARVGPATKLRNGILYREVTAQVAWNPGGWQVERLDEGFRAIPDGEQSNSTKRNTMTNTDGTRPQQPVLLDGGGFQLTPGQDAVFNSFDVYNLANFTVVPGIQGVV